MYSILRISEAKQIYLEHPIHKLNDRPDRDKPRGSFSGKGAPESDDTAPNRGFACQETAPERTARN